MAKSKDELLKEAEELGLKNVPEDYQELRSAVAEAKEEAEEGEDEKEEKKKAKVEKKGDREARWKKFLESYKVQNPTKYEEKKAKGQFDKIPKSFK